jgi:hypothetical protein
MLDDSRYIPRGRTADCTHTSRLHYERPYSMYALIDSNNFFVSCERLFRPDLENAPVIVLSSNDGCAISRSAEAKALGVKMGEPIFKLRQRFRVIDGNLKRELRDKKYEIRREIMPRSGSQKSRSGGVAFHS